MTYIQGLSIRLLPFLLAIAATSVSATAAESDEFENKVRPLLAKNCWGCHRQTALGGLRLDNREAILQGGKSGPAVVPGKAAESLLVKAISYSHDRIKMPPSGKMSDADIATLTHWIDSGAWWPANDPAPAAQPAGTKGEYVITADQRAFWAFQPVRAVPPPKVTDESWPKTPIDRFILARLEQEKLKPVKLADKRTLARRAWYTLTGLPPSPESVERFAADNRPDAFNRLIDELLASPQYGERWGRHWLDVARYSDDSMSSTASEPPHPASWRYRNWVIAALNQDMPYDLFVKAQIAGDKLDPSNPMRYAAGTGFYALSPEMQDDRVDATTRGFLALTVACAQCHDHKFDPIPTKDFYSLQAIFSSSKPAEIPLAKPEEVAHWQSLKERVDKQQSVVNQFMATEREQVMTMLAADTAEYLLTAAGARPIGELDAPTLERWRKYLAQPRYDHPFLKPWTEAVQRHAPEAELRKLAAEFQSKVIGVLDERREAEEYNKIILGVNANRETAVNTAIKTLPRDKFLLWRDIFDKQNKDASSFFFSPDGVLYYRDKDLERFLSAGARRYQSSQSRLLEAYKKELPEKYPFLQAMGDQEKPADGRILIRGDKNNPGDVAPRRFLAILANGERKPFHKGSGRLQLAEAIASKDNPLTARVIVNRVWQHHFGRGLVATASNFGQMGERPTNPELLDYLAAQFMEHGWSLKWLHRQIMLSAAWQLASVDDAAALAADPLNKLNWRFPRQRRDAESLRDAMLSVSGLLDTESAGPAQLLDEKNRKRTVYGFISRRKMDGMLALFDFPNPNSSSEGRVVTNVPLQRLYMMNSPFVAQVSEALAKRFNGTPEERIRHMYQAVFQRAATSAEVEAAVNFAGSNRWNEVARALLSSNEFLFVD